MTEAGFITRQKAAEIGSDTALLRNAMTTHLHTIRALDMSLQTAISLIESAEHIHEASPRGGVQPIPPELRQTTENMLRPRSGGRWPHPDAPTAVVMFAAVVGLVVTSLLSIIGIEVFATLLASREGWRFRTSSMPACPDPLPCSEAETPRKKSAPSSFCCGL